MDEAYIKALKKMSINGDIIRQVADDIKIVYTPFHGTGNVPVRRILKELGFKHVYIVKEQEKPDPDFTTLEYPNPEDPKAFTLALKLAKEKMQISFWQQIRMPTDSVYIQKTPRQANTRHLQEICPVC